MPTAAPTAIGRDEKNNCLECIKRNQYQRTLNARVSKRWIDPRSSPPVDVKPGRVAGSGSAERQTAVSDIPRITETAVAV
jgi:hypothetical protein